MSASERTAGGTPPLGRILSATNGAGMRARLTERFCPMDAEELLARRSAPIAALETGASDVSDAVAGALRAAGATAVAAGGFVATVATAGQFAAATIALPGAVAELTALATAARNACDPPGRLRLRGRTLDLSAGAVVMGILNVTPDSFYERAGDIADVVARARIMAAEGAALVDIGGQSYAHWNPRIAAEEEARRVVPAVRAVVAAGLNIAVSVDTYKPGVARAALETGADLINDCSGLVDSELAGVVAQHNAGLVIMHLKGELNVRSPDTYVYADALAEIVEFLHLRIEAALAAGVARESIAIDPGLEFGKEPATDLEILDRFSELTVLGFPILFASSRKSFIGRLFDRPAQALLVPSLATAGLGIAAGARILRVHDVAETVALARMYAAVDPQRRTTAAFARHMPGTPAASNLAPRDVV